MPTNVRTLAVCILLFATSTEAARKKHRSQLARQSAELFSSSTVGEEFQIATVPRSFVAHVTVPSDFGDSRVGVIAGSYPNTHGINWEVHKDGKPRLYWNEGEVDWKVDVNLRTGDNQLAFVVNEDGTEAKFYLNGVETSSRSASFSSVWPAGPIKIGGDQRSGNTQAFRVSDGIHCVKVFSHVISEDELSQHCQTPDPTPSPPARYVWATRSVEQSDLTHLMCGSQNCGVRNVPIMTPKICASRSSRARCFYWRNDGGNDQYWVLLGSATLEDGVFTCPSTEDNRYHYHTQRRIIFDNGDGGEVWFTFAEALERTPADCR